MDEIKNLRSKDEERRDADKISEKNVNFINF